MKIFINNETGKYAGEGDNSITMEGCFSISEIEPEKLEKLKKGAIYQNGEIVETEEYSEKIEAEKKAEKIENFKNKKSEAERLRLEYLTAELLPEGENRTKILASLEEKRQTLATEMDLMITEFISEYGEEILENLLG